MSAPQLDNLTPANLSLLDVVDPLTTPRYFVIGYDNNGAGRLVRFSVDAIFTGITLVEAPAALGFGADGEEGQIAFDADYVYTYSATNGWGKSARTF